MANNNRAEWRLQLIDARTRKPFTDDTSVAKFMTAGTPTLATLYAGENDGTAIGSTDVAATTADNKGKITASGGAFRFYVEDTVTSLDVTIYTGNGESVFVKGLTQSDQHIDVDTSAIEQMMVIPFRASNNAAVDTGFTFKGDVLLQDCFIDVTTVDGEDLSVGVNGTTTGDDPDGLLVTASVAALGIVKAAADHGAKANSHITEAADVTVWTKVSAAETDCNVTYTGSAGSDTAAGYIYVKYLKLPN
jgi:hypothetical protein